MQSPYNLDRQGVQIWDIQLKAMEIQPHDLGFAGAWGGGGNSTKEMPTFFFF